MKFNLSTFFSIMAKYLFNFRVAVTAFLTLCIVLTYQNCSMKTAGLSPNANAISNQSPGNSTSVTADELKILNESIDNLNSLDRHCQADADCVPVALGSLACGGPQRYVIASKLNTVFDNLVAMADDLKTREVLYNQQQGIRSICSIVLPPTTTCIDSKCQ